MSAPIIVALNREYAEQVWRHIAGEVYLDRDVDQLLEAMIAAAVTKMESLRKLQSETELPI